MSSIECQTDRLVVGSGAAGMAAAAVAAVEGLHTLVVEKTDTVGGTTAISVGMASPAERARGSVSGARRRTPARRCDGPGTRAQYRMDGR